jgi:6-pyruvoyltetrahydropterin/6-carboxytetrahydropterin synthase
MYEVSVEAEFAAAHALSIAGQRETTHGHNWHVTVTVSGPSLDSDGLLCDFHTIESALRELTARFHNRDLNGVTPFVEGLNPSAENVAAVLAEGLSRAISPLSPHAEVTAVRVTEAPGCAATYRPGGNRR